MTPRQRIAGAAITCVLLGASLQALTIAPASATCGVWRWDVKTLSDPLRTAVDFGSVPKSLLRLRRLTPPSSLNSTTPRLRGVERRTYDVRAQVVEAKIEDDGDIHLVIASRRYRHRTMIVEFPNTNCVASGFKRDRMRAARREVLDASARSRRRRSRRYGETSGSRASGSGTRSTARQE